MRFSFNGGMDVPDWLLSQIFIVSKISAVKIKVVSKLVLQQARGEQVDQAKIAKMLLGDGKFEEHEGKGVVAALHFVLTRSSRFDVAEDVLMSELQQLGLPNEHADALVSALRDGRAPLQRHQAATSLQYPKLEGLQWRVHEDPGPSRAHAVEMQLSVRAPPPAESGRGEFGIAAGAPARPPPEKRTIR